MKPSCSPCTEKNDGIGEWLGLCNRTACRAPGANFWNTSTRKFYCRKCANLINRECRRIGEPNLCQ